MLRCSVIHLLESRSEEEATDSMGLKTEQGLQSSRKQALHHRRLIIRLKELPFAEGATVSVEIRMIFMFTRIWMFWCWNWKHTSPVNICCRTWNLGRTFSKEYTIRFGLRFCRHLHLSFSFLFGFFLFSYFLAEPIMIFSSHLFSIIYLSKLEAKIKKASSSKTRVGKTETILWCWTRILRFVIKSGYKIIVILYL